MKRMTVISLFFLTCAGAATQNAAAQNAATQSAAARSELPGSAYVARDSLAMNELPPPSVLSGSALHPVAAPGAPLFGPTGGSVADFPFASKRSFPASRPGLSRLPSMSISPPAPVKFVMPERDLFVAHDRYRRQEGITIPTGGVNSRRMIAADMGYMPLVIRGNRALGLTGSRQRYPSMGFSNSISVGYIWAATDRITLYGNLNASDNMYHLTRFKDFGVSGRARIQLTERIFLNGYGTYSLYNSAGAGQLPLGMYPTSSFGGTIEVKITEKFGIEGGAVREYDPFTRKWRTNYYAAPVFY